MTDAIEHARGVIEAITKDRAEGEPAPERRFLTADEEQLKFRRERVAHVGSRVPARYQKVDFAEARKRAPLLEGVELESLCACPSSLLIVGPTGAGKTTMAASLMRMMLVHSYKGDQKAWRAVRSAWFHVASDLGRAIEQVAPWEECKTAELALSASWLCIDDLGTERGARAIDEICHIISHRYNEQLPTVVTTAVGFGEMTKRYGEGIVRRLIEVPDNVIELGGGA